jgi:putative SOS response-associated peptidase YedK
MCGRFVLNGTPEDVKKRYGIDTDPPLFFPHYNIAPGAMIPIIRNDNKTIAVLAKWGLIPPWAKDPKIGYRMINARAESVSEKPAFRRPFLSKRCLIPASGFYEWQHLDREKIPFYIRVLNERIFSFAGLFEERVDVEGRPLLSCTIITTVPNDTVKSIHDRMPVILAKEIENQWLDRDIREPKMLQKFLVPYPAEHMKAYPVSKAVNNPASDSPALIEKQEKTTLF